MSIREHISYFFSCLEEVFRSGQSREYRILRLKEAFGLLSKDEHGRAGLIGHKPLCFCNGPVAYNDRYDAYYCVSSKTWLEDGCDDPTCIFCSGHPALAPYESKQS